MWANWWTRRSLREGLPFYHTTDILYPGGVPLYFHSFSHTNTALWLLLEPLLGSLAAYNAVVLVGFILLGFGVYLVVYELTGRASAGVVAGMAATFAPYHVWECVHPNIFSTHFIPLLLWASITLFRRPTWWRGALVGLFCALNVFSSWHQPMYAAVMVGPYWLWSLFTRREEWRDLWPALPLAFLVAAVLIGPVAAPLLREQIRGGYAEPDINWVFNADALALVTPSFLHPLWGDAVRPLYDRFPAPNRPAFVGYALLLLALLGLPRLRRKHVWLGVTTLLALVLALGDSLYVNGHVVWSNLPWYAPIIGFVRTPIRFSLVLGQCLAILSGLTIANLLSRTKKPSLLIAHCSLLIVLFEFLAWPFPTTRAYVPPFYDQLAREPDTFAIVEAPLDRQTDKYYMYWQTLHGKPLVNGHVSRPPASAFDFVQQNAVTRAFAQREPLRGRPGLGAEMAALAAANVRYVVIHKQFLPPELAADWTLAMATRPVYEDDDLAVFSTQPQPGVHFGVEHDLDGLRLSQAWVERGQPPTFESHWSAPEQRDVTLALRAADGTDLSTQALAVEAGAYSVARAELDLAGLPQGEYELLLSTAAASFVLPQRLVVTPSGWFAARVQTDVTWNDSIALRGIDWHRLANTLYVELQWETRQEPGADLKYFVHLLPVDGTQDSAPVAQFDGVPRDWSYPTSLWETGELVADQATIDLRTIPAGDYRLAIGWYAPDTGERLPGVDASGQPLPQGRLLLDQVITIIGEK
jgi:hypothetical protein